MENLNFFLDFVIIGAAAWTVYVVRRIGGDFQRSFGIMVWGMIMLGFAHIIETITFEYLQMTVDVVEFVHRIIVLAGIVLLTLGFVRASQAHDGRNGEGSSDSAAATNTSSS